MKFEYTGRHLEVTPALRSHVESHFDKINHLFDGNNSKAHVIIEVEKGRHRSEIVVNWRKEILTANTTLPDMYQSLTKTIDKIEKQASRLKKKITDKQHKAIKVATVPTDGDVSPEPTSPQIIETKRYSVKPMTAEEAVIRLNDGENQFLVFRNADNDRISVIYKRQDGNYGLIQP
jgi:ribosome hibernation promoting factor